MLRPWLHLNSIDDALGTPHHPSPLSGRLSASVRNLLGFQPPLDGTVEMKWT